MTSALPSRASPTAFPKSSQAFHVPLYHRPAQSRSQARFDLIMSVARTHISGLTLSELSLTTIAERAGVSVQSLYRYFPDIRGIFGKLLEDFYADMNLSIQQYLVTSHSPDHWQRDLTQFVRDLADYAIERPYVMKMQLICRLDPEVEVYWWQMVGALQEQLVLWLRLIGYSSKDLSEADAAQFIVMHLDALLLDLGRSTNLNQDDSIARYTQSLIGYLSLHFEAA